MPCAERGKPSNHHETARDTAGDSLRDATMMTNAPGFTFDEVSAIEQCATRPSSAGQVLSVAGHTRALLARPSQGARLPNYCVALAYCIEMGLVRF